MRKIKRNPISVNNRQYWILLKGIMSLIAVLFIWYLWNQPSSNNQFFNELIESIKSSGYIIWLGVIVSILYIIRPCFKIFYPCYHNKKILKYGLIVSDIIIILFDIYSIVRTFIEILNVYQSDYTYKVEIIILYSLLIILLFFTASIFISEIVSSVF